MTRLGILGGTFDPIHVGHLDVAEAARVALELDEVILVPSRVPPHRRRPPVASGYHRFAMIGLAMADRQLYRASDLELNTEGPSYTSVTLDTFARHEVPPSQLFFIAGADAFAEIATWHAYPDVLDCSHFIVVSRPGHRATQLMGRLPDLASRMRDPGHRVQGGESEASTSVWLVETKTRDISSSDIRGRLARGESITGLVPPLVAAYVERHGLYAGSPPEGALHE